MDGNGRWATRRGRPRTAGHLAGARATRRLVRAAARAGVGTLTLYAFSADNWARPAGEVGALMQLFARHLDAEAERCARDGVRLQVIGRRDRLGSALLAAVERAEAGTAAGRGLRVRLAIDYSARDAIVAAAARLVPTVHQPPAPPRRAPHRAARTAARTATGAAAPPWPWSAASAVPPDAPRAAARVGPPAPLADGDSRLHRARFARALGAVLTIPSRPATWISSCAPRRAPTQRLPPVGVRIRGAVLHRCALADSWRGTSTTRSPPSRPRASLGGLADADGVQDAAVGRRSCA
jgi:hypothetical protein